MALGSTQPLIEMSKGKGKSVPLQARTGPEGSRKLKRPDFKTLKLLVICILRVLLSHSFIFFRFFFFINVYMVLFLLDNVIYVFFLL
jgi:hypothetical protein